MSYSDQQDMELSKESRLHPSWSTHLEGGLQPRVESLHTQIMAVHHFQHANRLLPRAAVKQGQQQRPGYPAHSRIVGPPIHLLGLPVHLLRSLSLQGCQPFGSLLMTDCGRHLA